MKTQQLLRQWNGKTIRQRADGWLSLTDMAASCDKRFAHWHELQSTQEFITYEETITGIPVMVVNVGGSVETTGTWGNPEIAIDFARWLSIPFRSQVNKWIAELLTEGTVSMGDKPIDDFEVVKAVGALAPRVITQQHESYAHMLPDRTNWVKAMGLERDRIIRTWKSNPIVCAQLIADHDGFVGSHFPPLEPVAVAPRIHLYRDRSGKTTEFDLTAITALLAPLTFVTTAYLRTIVDMPPTMKVHTLLRALGWTAAIHLAGGTREAFDVPRGEHSEGIPCWVRVADYALISAAQTDVISTAVLVLVPAFVKTLASGDAVDVRKLTIAFNMSQNVMHVSPRTIQGVLVKRHGYRQLVRYEGADGPINEPFWVNLPLQQSGCPK